MSLYILARDPDGNCCGCEARVEPCDSCGGPVACTCILPWTHDITTSEACDSAMNESMDYFKKYLKTGRENKGNIIIYSTPADEDFDGSDKNRNFWNDWNDKK